jgi:hypothetical protein
MSTRNGLELLNAFELAPESFFMLEVFPPDHLHRT